MRQNSDDIATGQGFNEPDALESVDEKLGNIENELVLLNEKAEGWSSRSLESLLFLILLALIYIAIKLS